MDTETGGRDKAIHSLLTLYAVVLYDDLSSTNLELDLKIKPDNGKYVCENEALAINKINLVEHDEVAESESACKIKTIDFLLQARALAGNKLVIAGHNVGFDVGFVQSKLISPGAWNMIFDPKTLDTLTIARDLAKTPTGANLPKSKKLESLAQFFNISCGTFHDAKADVLTTIELLKRLIEIQKTG